MGRRSITRSAPESLAARAIAASSKSWSIAPSEMLRRAVSWNRANP
jgi:hypothetical protein